MKPKLPLFKEKFNKEPKNDTVLYHYTSQQGLLGIFKNKNLWASKIQFLNDEQEFKYAFEKLRNKLLELNDKSDKKASKYIDCLSDMSRAFEHTNMFIFSLSEKGDQLSQWRGYTKPGQGYCIGFKYKHIKEIIDSNVPNTHLVQCIYDEDIQNDLIEEYIHNHDLIEDSIFESDEDFYKYGNAYLYISNFLYLAGILKHPSFEEEKEWRLISPMIDWSNSRLKFRQGKSILIPYYEFSAAKKGHNVPFEKIIIGPTPHPKLSKNSIDGFLYSLYHDANLKIKSSSTPFRDW